MLLKDASTRLAAQGIRPLTLSLETPSLTARSTLQIFIIVAKQQIEKTWAQTPAAHTENREPVATFHLLPTANNCFPTTEMGLTWQIQLISIFVMVPWRLPTELWPSCAQMRPVNNSETVHLRMHTSILQKSGNMNYNAWTLSLADGQKLGIKTVRFMVNNLKAGNRFCLTQLAAATATLGTSHEE